MKLSNKLMFAATMAFAMMMSGATAALAILPIGDVAYVRGANGPWVGQGGEAANVAAMDLAFGAGQWVPTTMAADAGAVFDPVNGFRAIFLEGGDFDALELDAYVTANRVAIESWVARGGSLLLDSAPNEGGDMDWGFGGVTLTDGNNSGTVDAADPAHPIFNGPNAVGVTQFTGNAFGHATITDATGHVMPLIVGATGDGADGLTVLGEMRYGAGLVLFGGMTTDNFHDPQPDAANLRANILHYLYNVSLGPVPDDDPLCGNLIPVGGPHAPWGLAIVPLMLLGVWLVRRKV